MYKILLIEDEDTLRKNLQEILEHHNYDVVAAENGLLGIQKIFNDSPDLVICDVMMPEVDGHDVLKTVRKSQIFSNLPFIFLTARSSHEEHRLGMELGADDYLTKPFVMDDLLKVIKTRIDRKESLQIEMLQKVEHYQKNLSNVYSHEFSTGLSSIQMAADILLQHHTQMSPAHLSTLFLSIKKAVERIDRTIKNLQLFAELSTLKDETEHFDTQEGPISYKIPLTELSQQLGAFYQRKEDLHIDLSDCELLLPIPAFLKILEEIIDNAFKFSEAGDEICVTSFGDGQFCRIEISNTGQGCKELNTANFRAFQQFNRQTQEQQGNGLGLHLAKRLTLAYKGSLIAQSIPDKTTKITLTFPIFLKTKMILD